MWTDNLGELDACEEAVEWASSYPTLEAAWAACERGDWMLWLAGRLAGPSGDERRRALVLAACECAELGMPNWEARRPDDRRPQEALAAARAWTRGEATLEEVEMAWGDAQDSVFAAYEAAADAAYAASSPVAADALAAYAAAYAADAAAYAAYIADDSDVAHVAGCAAYVADAAARAAAAAAHADAAAAVMRAQCADIVRRHYPEPPGLLG